MRENHRPQRRDAVISRVRLRGHDYSSPGTYFITSCIEHRMCLLGSIVDDRLVPSRPRKMVAWWWQALAERFPVIHFDAMVVMPNHMHALIMIPAADEGMAHPDAPSISTVKHWFHTKTTNDYIDGVRRENWPRYPGRLWQERFIDHIVRSDQALERIRRYIEANPSQWHLDNENPAK